MITFSNTTLINKDREYKSSQEFSFTKNARSEDSRIDLIQQIRAFPLDVIQEVLTEFGKTFSGVKELHRLLATLGNESLNKLLKHLFERSNVVEEDSDYSNYYVSDSSEKMTKEAQFVEKQKNILLSNLNGSPPDEVEHFYNKVTGGVIDIESEEAQSQLERLSIDELQAIYDEIWAQYTSIDGYEDREDPEDLQAPQQLENLTNDRRGANLAFFETNIKMASVTKMDNDKDFGIDKEKYPNLYKLYSGTDTMEDKDGLLGIFDDVIKNSLR